MEQTTFRGQDWAPLLTYFFHNKSRHAIIIYSVTNYNVVTDILEDASLKTGSNLAVISLGDGGRILL
jgi:hypothetical protein